MDNHLPSMTFSAAHRAAGIAVGKPRDHDLTFSARMKWLLLLPLFFFHAGCEQHGSAELALLEPHQKGGAESHGGPASAPAAKDVKQSPDASGPKYFQH